MSTGLEVFDTTVQEANQWLSRLEAELPPCDRRQAYGALRAVLHVLRDRLPLEAVLGLSSQLPLLLRGVFLEGWQALPPTNLRDPKAFAEAVANQLPPHFPREALGAVEAVFSVMANRLDPGEITKIIQHLPAPLRATWPAAYRAA
ncbi:DUF2267 domain-containing protein [Phenylobacterium immobile]|uniref:DUF2267 domain-containing protein n=1 Tax=Phenylobacterium immobile TaxID=21 RepID=UPI000AA6028D|nr:DUF2267 domain-containing protein [Phenylobacterium immobile]